MNQANVDLPEHHDFGVMFILLIGPKGSGKSHIGRLLEEHLGVHFFHVEPLWMSYHANCESNGQEPSIPEGIRWVHPILADALTRHLHLCVETTGASAEILEDLLRQGERTEMMLVKVTAPISVCLERIRTRDQTHQIPSDEDRIRLIYDLNAALELPFDVVLDNTNSSSPELVDPIARLLKERAVGV